MIKKQYFMISAIFMSIFVFSLYYQGIGASKQKRIPTEFAQHKANRKEIKKNRKAFYEKMHKAAPDVDWKEIDRKTRQEKVEKIQSELEYRLQLGQLNRNDLKRITTANRNLVGDWSERGSNNLAGRIRTAEIDFENNVIYCASSGGNIWKGNLDGSNWTSLNDYMQITGVTFLRNVNNNGNPRLLIGSNGGFYYSDNDGILINSTIGLESVINIKRYHSNGSDIYAMVKEWDSDDIRYETKLYRSTDYGTSFQFVVSFEPNEGFGSVEQVDHFDFWTDRYFGGDVYIVNDGSFYKLTQDDQIEYISSLNTNYSGDVLLTGGMGLNSPFFYAHINSQIFYSSNGGDSWVNRGQNPAGWFFTNNSFNSSCIDKDNIFIGGMEAFRSSNNGQNWVLVNDWWDYYSDPSDELHADIPEIRFFLDENFNEVALISTDGGLYYSDDYLLSVENLSLFGLGVSQYYSTYTNRSAPHHIYAGSQDQGFQRSNGDDGGILEFDQSVSGDYGHLVSGDGGETLWCNYPGFTMYYDNPQFDQGGETIDFPGNGHLWLAPLMADPDNPNVAYLGGGGLNNGNHLIKLTASAWSISYEENPSSFSGTVSAMAISPLDNDYWYVLTETGKFYHSSDHGQEWQMTSNFNGPTPQHFYGSTILPSHTELGKVYIGGSGYSNYPVYYTNNHGGSFHAMSNGLPNTLIYKLDSSEDDLFIFAATEVGPYVYDTYQEEWYDLAGTGAPDQLYWSVEYIPELMTARFGTYGRGIWDFTLDENYNIVLGDVNEDNHVNIQDIIIMINFILYDWNPTPTQMLAGDLNNDGLINVTDIISVVNIILSGGM